MNNNFKVIDDRKTGTLVWLMPDGKIVQDAEGHFLSLPARKGDPRRMNIMREYVLKEFGINVGRPVWVSNRQVTDEEFDHQIARAKFGLTPDPIDDVVNEVNNGKSRL